MKAILKLAFNAVVVLMSGQMLGQVMVSSAPAKSSGTAKNPWAFNLTIDGFMIRSGTSYANPTFTVDRDWLHLEARYNYEDLSTASFWAGYNFSAGKKLVLEVTPMVGGIFGRTKGIAPGCGASLTYEKVRLSIANEYVFDLKHKSDSFYYSWPQITYSPVDWFRVGGVAQHTKAFHTSLDVQRGFLAGVSHKPLEFTTYIFNPGSSNLTVTLELGVSF